jgi:hypothetical protein
VSLRASVRVVPATRRCTWHLARVRGGARGYVQTAPTAAEPTSFTYLASTPVV